MDIIINIPGIICRENDWLDPTIKSKKPSLLKSVNTPDFGDDPITNSVFLFKIKRVFRVYVNSVPEHAEDKP